MYESIHIDSRWGRIDGKDVGEVLLSLLQNFDAEVSAVVAETVWDTPERQKYLSETIVEHLYRQGMLSVAEDLCQVL